MVSPCASISATVGCSYVAASLNVVDYPDQPFLPNDNPYEMHRVWHRELLASRIIRGNAGAVTVIFGLVPTDTGYHLNPMDTSSLVFDESFQPRLPSTQSYMLKMCSTIEDIIRAPDEEYLCVMQAFDLWLREEHQSSNQTEAYSMNCQEADSIPMEMDSFDACLIEYSKILTESSGVSDVMHDDASVKILTMRGRSNTTVWSPYVEQAKEWQNIESWYQEEVANAPFGAKFFYTSQGKYLF